ncbi:MAG: hypothetical protein IJ218_02470 [Alphaproteobacteria bacterium]|nr:hypothetical protein [Alphaproteobacteria bacterium]
MKTILEICKEVADLAAVKRPNDLFNVAGQQDRIFLSIAKSSLDSLLRYGDWQELTKEAWFVTIAGKKQYRINEIVADFYCLLADTIYIKDSTEKIIGAVTPQQWMKEKYCCTVSADIKFKLQNGCFVFINEPPCGTKIVFQYRSNNIVWDFNTFEEKNVLSANTDVPIFDEYVVKLDILWRWLKRNGLDYAEEYNEYLRELKKRYGAERLTENISLAKPELNEEGEINAIKIIKSCR